MKKKGIHSSKIVAKFVKFSFQVLFLGICLNCFGGVLWGRDPTYFPNGAKIAQWASSLHWHIKKHFSKSQIARTSELWQFVEHPRSRFPFLCLLLTFGHCQFLVYRSAIRGFSVVNHACFFEDRECEHRGGAESTMTTDHAEQPHTH